MSWIRGFTLTLFGFGLVMACSANDGGGDGPGTFPGSGGSGGSGQGGSGQGGSGQGGSTQAGSSTGAQAGTFTTGGTGFAGSSFGGSGGSGVEGDAACTASSSQADAAVDIIWVVDNSCSMEDEINKIQTNIDNSFVDIIQGSNLAWNVIFISGRPDYAAFLPASYNVCVSPPLAGANCSDNAPRFYHVACGVGSGNSLAVAASSFAGGAPLANIEVFSCEPKRWQNLLRFQATKVFIFVTDDETTNPAQDFDFWLTDTAQPDPFPGQFGTQQDRKYIVNAIIGMDKNNPSQACTSATNSAVAPGLQYQQLAQVTGGQVASICEDDWSDIFNSVANTIVDTLGCEYPVPAPPPGETLDPNKVNVSFTDQDGNEEKILQDTTAGCDAGANGWQWDPTFTKVLLCGEACERIKADPKGKVDILFGCETEIVIPK